MSSYSAQNTDYRPEKAPIPVTIVILTKNEVDNIAPCLHSCSWSDDVHVLDSGSTDGTCEVAREFGVQVHINPFESFGKQRNWAIDNIPAKHKWQFHLDADERFTPDILAEMAELLGADGTRSDKAGYLVPSKLIFMGRWLRRSAKYPTYQVRLFHSDRCRFMDFGHGQREETTGEIAKLKQPYLHFNFSKGLTDWVAKHNNYSSREAHEALHRRGEPGEWRGLFASDGVKRRRALKSLAYNVPCRPLVRFLYSYVASGGFLDGRAGLHYCLLMSFYEYLTELKLKELQGKHL